MQLKLDAFLHPSSPRPTDETDAVQLTGQSNPPKRARSPIMADNALVTQCLKKPAKRRCKALRLAKPLKRHRTAAKKLAYLEYADTQISQR